MKQQPAQQPVPPSDVDACGQWARLPNRAPALWTALHATLARFTSTPDIETLNRVAQRDGLANAKGQPVSFVEQLEPCGQQAYEREIGEHGRIPTRPGLWHDVFNACMWLNYPVTKAALNAQHLTHHTTHHTTQPDPRRRSPAGDAATVFDESGAILIGPDPRLAQWLKQHDWQSAFVTHRELWSTHHLLIIGHAVLEKLANPYPGMIAKVLYQPWPALLTSALTRPPDGLDDAVAYRWRQGEFKRPADLFPVPVLGIPGADAANGKPDYYNNTAVFRPKPCST